MLSRLFQGFVRAVTFPTDSSGERFRKIAFVFIQLLYVLLSLASVGTYAPLGLAGGVVIYLTSTLLGLLLFGFLIRTKRFRQYVNLTLVYISSVHLTTRVLQGGYQSGVMIWFILVPLAATIFLPKWQLIVWWMFFAIVELALIPLDPWLANQAMLQAGNPAFFYGFSVVAVVTVLVVVFRYLVNEIDEARKQADLLLLNILPGPIAERLKQRPEVIADGYPEVTILFADIVGFTRLTSHVNPVEVVRVLNEIFSDLDDLAKRHGLEKIKTTGDGYMVAGGLPVTREDHCDAVVSFGLDMLDRIKRHQAWNHEPIHLRVGIDTGPVVAGVIGRHKFIYDLWGDAVNTASRMESNGLVDVIQVTEAVKRKLNGKYTFEQREPIDIKGKGQMVTYLLRP
jgi:class 3 adenylate cyclase